jgi:type I restriction enzyme R subunit
MGSLVASEAKREEEGHKLNIHEVQSEGYAAAKLKLFNNSPLPFVYVSTGEVTKFTDFTDPNQEQGTYLVFTDRNA